MPRIRSIHPGQWTDGDFMECSVYARLLCLALRNFADDRGAFRWKPKTIKAQCLPADNVDIEALLSELEENDQIIRYESSGKSYGLIADFTQWQKPKKPTAIYPIPEPVRKQQGLIAAECDTSSEPVPNQFRTDTEIPPQREEGGGNSDVDVSARDPNIDFGVRCCDAANLDPMARTGHLPIVARWLREYPPELILTTIQDVSARMAATGHDPPRSLKYFDRPIANAFAEQHRPNPEPNHVNRPRPKPSSAAGFAALIADFEEVGNGQG